MRRARAPRSLLALLVRLRAARPRRRASRTSSCPATRAVATREAPDRQARGVRIATARIVFITHGQASDEFWKVVKRGIEEAHRQSGAAVSYRAPDRFSIERMRRFIDEAVADQPDGLVVSLPDATALSPSIKAAVQRRHPGGHDQLRQRRVPQARRARPRRPARVRGGRRGRRADGPRGRPARAVRQPGERQRRASTSAAAASPTASPRPAAGRRARCRSRCRTRASRSAGWPRRSTAGPVDGILTLGPGGATPALDAVRASGLALARASSRPSTSRPTCWPPCATARCSSRSTSSRTCRATCR